MHCTQCGNQLVEGSKFCTSCGAKVEMNAEPSTTSPEFKEPQVEAPAQPNTEETNDYVQQGKQIGQQYIGFMMDALKKPFSTSVRASEVDKVNGIITILLFSLLVPLYYYVAAKQIGGYFYYEPSFMDMVLTPFIVLAIFFAILIGVKLAVSKLMKAELSYFDVLTKFGALMVVPTLLVLLSVLFLLLSVDDFSSTLLAIGLFFTSISSSGTLFAINASVENKNGLDVFYGIILTYLAMIIVLLIIGDSILGNVFDQIGSNFMF